MPPTYPRSIPSPAAATRLASGATSPLATNYFYVIGNTAPHGGRDSTSSRHPGRRATPTAGQWPATRRSATWPSVILRPHGHLRRAGHDAPASIRSRRSRATCDLVWTRCRGAGMGRRPRRSSCTRGCCRPARCRLAGRGTPNPPATNLNCRATIRPSCRRITRRGCHDSADAQPRSISGAVRPGITGCVCGGRPICSPRFGRRTRWSWSIRCGSPTSTARARWWTDADCGRADTGAAT